MIAAERVTVFEGTPAMFRSMLAAADRCPQNLDSLRVCLSIGSPIPADALRRFEDKFGCTVVQATDSALLDAWRATGTVGREET
jgi:long-chain acyl-CoA synthetase